MKEIGKKPPAEVPRRAPIDAPAKAAARPVERVVPPPPPPEAVKRLMRPSASEIKRLLPPPTAELKRLPTPAEVKRLLPPPTAELKRLPNPAEVKRFLAGATLDKKAGNLAKRAGKEGVQKGPAESPKPSGGDAKLGHRRGTGEVVAGGKRLEKGKHGALNEKRARAGGGGDGGRELNAPGEQSGALRGLNRETSGKRNLAGGPEPLTGRGKAGGAERLAGHGKAFDASKVSKTPNESDVRSNIERDNGRRERVTPGEPSGVEPDRAGEKLSPPRELIRYPGQREGGVLDRQERALTDVDRKAMRDYGGNTAEGREKYNNVLREGKALDRDTRERVARLDAAIKSPYEADTVIYRGVHARSEREAFLNLAAMEPGDVIWDRGYQSGTPDIEVARNYADEQGRFRVDPVTRNRLTAQRAIFEIEVPKGTHVAHLDRYNEHGEAEDLLPRDSMLEYRGRYVDDEGYAHVRFRYLQSGLPGDSPHAPSERIEHPPRGGEPVRRDAMELRGADAEWPLTAEGPTERLSRREKLRTLGEALGETLEGQALDQLIDHVRPLEGLPPNFGAGETIARSINQLWANRWAFRDPYYAVNEIRRAFADSLRDAMPRDRVDDVARLGRFAGTRLRHALDWLEEPMARMVATQRPEPIPPLLDARLGHAHRKLDRERKRKEDKRKR